MRFRCYLAVTAVLSVTILLHAQAQLDLKDPNVRKMIIAERKGMDCAGIYQQTKLKLDAQLKAGSKLDASAGVTPQTLANMTELTTTLGQSRRELCEFYKHDPEFTKDDYFRQVGELNKGESDASLLLRVIGGKASPEELKSGLQTVKPQQSGSGSIDVNATIKEVLHTVDAVNVRVGKAEGRIGALESQSQPRHLSAQQVRDWQTLVDALPPSVKFQVVAPSDIECQNYAEQFGSVIKATHRYRGAESVATGLGWPNGIPTGLLFEIHSADDPVANAAAEFVKKTQKLGIPAEPRISTGIPTGTIGIVVGAKPELAAQ